MRKQLASLLLVFSLLAPALTQPGWAQTGELQLIRDAEIEDIIRAYATPLFQAAGLSPQAIDVYLIKDDSLNAFVTPGLNMFIHTGLLMRSEGPLQVIGVVAHETGHIAGGHLIGRMDEMQNASIKALAAAVLGLGAALATGRPELGGAVSRGGQDVALKGLLRYSRGQEAAADQAALRLLSGTGQSPRGLVSFLNILGDQEVFLATNQDPYLRTHPLTPERLSYLEQAVQESPYADMPPPPEYVEMHHRMRGKLVGFLEPFDEVLRRYPKSDTSLEARYARAIAHYRRADLDTALPLVDQLITEHPEDAYLRELKGQMLFENGRLAEALPEYEIAVRLDPSSPLLHLGLARVLLELNQPGMDAKALDHLDTVLQHEPNGPFAWRLAAVAHGRLGDQGMTALALAEAAIAHGETAEARAHAKRAQKLLKNGSPGGLRVQDILHHADQLDRQQ